MSTTDTSRREILDGIKTFLMAAFNSQTGTNKKLFRDAYRGPVKVVQANRPVLGVSDGGQRRMDGGDTEESSERLLTVTLTLHLFDSWDKPDPAADWTDYVEKIAKALSAARDTIGCGVMFIRYASDDPVNLVWADGGADSEAAWVIEFEVQRVVDY
jgi:hypothetical protein